MNDENIKIFPKKKSSESARREYLGVIADKIRSLVADEGFSSGDIMVLVQRRNPFASILANELKARGIDVAGSDRIVLPNFPAIRDLLNLVRFCLEPDDDYSLCCTLKSPFYMLKERDIFNICRARKDAENALENEKKGIERPRVFDMLQSMFPDIFSDLSELIECSKSMAPYSFFTHVLNSSSRREKMIAALGSQILDPLEEFLAICLAYERTHPGTLRHFLKWFIQGGSEIKRDMDASSGARIVTVHGSKGLEAPVVFLIDTVRTPKDKPDKIFPIEPTLLEKNPGKTNVCAIDEKILTPWLWAPHKTNSEKLDIAAGLASDKKTAEYYRLLYVAMTRARDRLYVYGFSTNKNPPEIAWHAQLWGILQTMPGARVDDEKIMISN